MAVTQAQIAKMAGVSRGTVDRALNNRGRIDPETVARIKKIADEMDYRPNKAGSLLVRAKRPIRLGVIVQSIETPFMRMIYDEIEKARFHMKELGAELLVETIQAVDLDQQLALLDKLRAEKIDGLAFTPIEDDRICNKVDELQQAGIPTVTFNTDLPASKRLCYVGQDNHLSGRACAGLMNLLLNGSGSVLMITGYVSNLSQQRRVEGFSSEMRMKYPNITLLPLERCGDSNEVSYEIVSRVVKENPALKGIYFSAGGPAGGCAAIRALGLEGKIHFICHDLTADNANNVKNGLIDFLIDQDAHTQAVRSLEVLYEYILTGRAPAKEYMFTHIDIRNQYNV